MSDLNRVRLEVDELAARVIAFRLDEAVRFAGGAKTVTALLDATAPCDPAFLPDMQREPNGEISVFALLAWLTGIPERFAGIKNGVGTSAEYSGFAVIDKAWLAKQLGPETGARSCSACDDPCPHDDGRQPGSACPPEVKP